MKKQVILGMTTLMFAGMISSVSAAGPAPTPVPVSYDNRNSVVDPDDPLAEWSVSIPTAVTFTKDATTKNVDVELVPINGAVIGDLTTTLSIDVKAKSTNGMKLKADTEELGYEVTYGGTSLLDTTEASIATLTRDEPKKVGTATLGTDKPTKLAIYTDTLTYTITKTVD